MQQSLGDTVQGFYGVLGRAVMICRQYLIRKRTTVREERNFIEFLAEFEIQNSSDIQKLAKPVPRISSVQFLKIWLVLSIFG